MYVAWNMQCELYMYSIASNTWHLLSSDTLKHGGPTLIYDHQVCGYLNLIILHGFVLVQMCFDNVTGVLYVSGGRMVGVDRCSGLYAYHTVDKDWLCLVPDQSGDVSLEPVIPRSCHVTLFHPVRCSYSRNECQGTVLGSG